MQTRLSVLRALTDVKIGASIKNPSKFSNFTLEKFLGGPQWGETFCCCALFPISFFLCVSICEMFLAGASGIMLIYFWCRNVLFYKYFEHRICNSENCMEYIKIADLGIKQMWSGIFWNVKIVIVKSVVEKHKEKVLTHFLA